MSKRLRKKRNRGQHWNYLVQKHNPEDEKVLKALGGEKTRWDNLLSRTSYWTFGQGYRYRNY